MAIRVTLFRCGECEACARQSEVLAVVRREAPPGVEVREIRVDRHPRVAEERGVHGHPVTILEWNGVDVRRWTGLVNKEEILGTIRGLLGSDLPGAPPPERATRGNNLPGKEQVPAPGGGQPPMPSPPGEPNPPGMRRGPGRRGPG